MKRILFFCIVILFVRCKTNTEVDLIIYNAKVYSVDSTFSTAEAFAVNDGVFIDIGSNEEILKRYHSQEIIDAMQQAIFPGFYDSHAHSFLYADFLQQVNLVGSRSMAELLQRLKDFRQLHANKRWIVGAGWDQNLWDDKAFPTKDSLDKYFPDIPIYLPY